jgi:hydrogenase nickel incorporation protein HypA/HybF
MHELSIAMSVVDVAGEEATRQGLRVIAVHLRLGPLSGVVKSALISAYELAREGSVLDGSKLVVREMPIIAWCPLCQAERTLRSPQHICCPICDTPTPDVRGGRELEIAGLEVVDDAANENGSSAPAGAQAK